MRGFIFVLSTVFLSSCIYGEEAKLKPPLKSPGSAAQIVDSSQQIADMIVKSRIPVFLDFWAVWCGPCKILNPIVAELEKEFDGKVLFLKVNVDIHKAIAGYFRVNAIPSIFIVNDKTVVKVIPGLQPKSVYAAALNDILAKNASSKPDSLSDVKSAKAQVQ